MLVTTLVVTLVPLHLAHPGRVVFSWSGGWEDFFANIVLFVPLGLFYRIARPGSRRPGLETLVLGFLLSTAIETVQLFEPDRFSSVWDVVSNSLGAWLGSAAYGRMSARSAGNTGFIARMALEVPLMGLVYLLIPLLWLDALTALTPRGSFWLTALLGLIGAGVVGTLQRQLFAPVGLFRAWETALLTAVWFVVGAYPALWARPRAGLFCLGLVTLVVLVQGSREAKEGITGKRFEVPVVQWVIPVFLAYLVLVAVWPPRWNPDWSVNLGFDRSVSGAGTVATLRLLEYVAAFTMLGYMLAELRSRKEESFRFTRGNILLVAVPLALGLEALRAFQPLHGASLLLLAMSVTASLYGGIIYHLARAHAREMRRGMVRASGRPSGRHQMP
jgi:VanZ family protein